MRDCRHFNGYSPCPKNHECQEQCPSYATVGEKVLFIHLGALGAVARSTALIKSIKRKHPLSTVTWLTQAPAEQLLKGIEAIDQVVGFTWNNILNLQARKFDFVYCVDKSRDACGVVEFLNCANSFGFRLNKNQGAIEPATQAAQELWEIGLSNQKKFFENQKTELELVHQSLELGPYRRDPYDLPLSPVEVATSAQRRSLWRDGKPIIVGLNTGCAATIPYKKLSIEGHRTLIQALRQFPEIQIVLLGGKEDSNRNIEIARGLDVVLSPTELGLRDGLCSVEACDIVVTGDSLGMHMAIARQKWTVAWFGPTCAQEIDLFDRGVKVRAPSPCSPCWKRTCSRTPMCYDEVSISELVNGVTQGMTWLKTFSSSKQHLSATHSSPSP